MLSGANSTRAALARISRSSWARPQSNSVSGSDIRRERTWRAPSPAGCPAWFWAPTGQAGARSTVRKTGSSKRDRDMADPAQGARTASMAAPARPPKSRLAVAAEAGRRIRIEPFVWPVRQSSKGIDLDPVGEPRPCPNRARSGRRRTLGCGLGTRAFARPERDYIAAAVGHVQAKSAAADYAVRPKP